MSNKSIKVAILDMNAGHPNLGLQSIVEVVKDFGNPTTYQVFDVRAKAEIPSLDFDIYISSGGPGSPFDGDGHWDKQYYDLVEQLWDWNKQKNVVKKHILFICYSFQMACIHFDIATIKRRKSISFGIFPTYKTAKGKQEALFAQLPDPFYIADFRIWQVVQPKTERLTVLGAEILTIEKERPTINLDRAIMAVRFSPEMIGVQFHPEAHPKGMLQHFSEKKRKAQVIRNHGKAKYEQMIADMQHPDRIALTYNKVIPQFLHTACMQLTNHLSLLNK